MTRRQLIGIGSLIVITASAGGIFALSRAADRHGSKTGGETDRGDARIAVRTVRPRLDTSFRIANEQIATVEPFYQAGLRTRAAGIIHTVPKEIGEFVRAGEVLVEIDAPDLFAEVEQKEAVIHQREQELRVSRALLRYADAAVEAAKATVSQRVAEAKQSAAMRDYKLSYLNRVQAMLADRTVLSDTVYESKKDYLAADAAVEAADVAIQRAKADQLEKEASQEAARTDIDLKAALVAVAKKDRDRSAVMAEFARLTAPFDGMIVKRSVDPGMFVQNATSAATEPLVTLARIDLVTVVMKLPDVAAPYISLDTDAEVTFLDRPDLKVHGKVTRFSPAIDGLDRTMRVELDVFNGPRSEFDQFLAQTYAEAMAPVGPGTGLGVTAAVLAAERHRRLFHKGVSEGTAVCPEVQTNGRTRPIVPGMTATMKVYLDRAAAAHLLPASAVYGSGGKTYVMLVENGVTKQVPVRVQVNDGRLAKVALLPGPGTVRELNGADEVVLTRQLEIGDGAKVKTVPADW